jgi:hypothetical protein
LSALPFHLNRSKLHVGWQRDAPSCSSLVQFSDSSDRVLKKSSALMIGQQAKIILFPKNSRKTKLCDNLLP